MSSLQSFHQFPQLPPEIRNMIWACVATKPRLIPLHPENNLDYGCDFNTVLGPNQESDIQRYIFPPQSPPPILMRTTSESRSFGLEIYAKVFGYHDMESNSRRFTYVNLGVDIVLCNHNILKHLPSKERDQIQNLVLKTHHEPLDLFMRGLNREPVFEWPEVLPGMKCIRSVRMVNVADGEADVDYRDVCGLGKREGVLRKLFGVERGVRVRFLGVGEEGFGRGCVPVGRWRVEDWEELMGRLGKVIEEEGSEMSDMLVAFRSPVEWNEADEVEVD